MDNNECGVLFLDFDGVICTSRAYYASEMDKGNHIYKVLDPICIKLINNLCKHYNLKIVLSTTWRRFYDCKTILFSHGFNERFHEDENTPYLNGENYSRGGEIRAWLDNHPEIKRFIIFDDSCDGIKDTELEKYFVRTHVEDGISTDNYRLAMEILERFKEK